MSNESPSEKTPGRRTAKDGAADLWGPELAPHWLSAIVESADDAIISKTPEGVITS